MSDSAAEGFGEAAGNLVRLVFSTMFPITILTACVVSGVLVNGFGIPHFALLWNLLLAAIGYALTTTWAAVALALFVLASLPLAWVAFKELARPISTILGTWCVAVVFLGGSLWLSGAWSYDRSGIQQFFFAALLFTGCSGLCEAVLGTLKIMVQVRPKPGREVVEKQKAHGHAQLAGEAEAVALLRKKR